MGVVLAKFRKEKTTTEVLEGLEEKIQTLEKYTLNTQEQKKRFVGNFLAISIGIYVIAFVVFCFVYFPPTWTKRILYSVPLLVFPLVIILLRSVFTWYFQRKLNKNSNKLTALRAEKKKILEQVMDKETYKVAVNLLARFADKTNGSRPAYGAMATTRTPLAINQPIVRAPLVASSNSQLSTTASLTTKTSALPMTPQPRPPPQPTSSLANTPRYNTFSPHTPQGGGQALRRRTPFPIVNQNEKGVFERIVDVLIGDGPQDRFAMICKECFAHNGMALKEDFEYTAFRCAFCNVMNPARKSRPVAPRLTVTTSHDVSRHKESSGSSSDDEDDSDVEKSKRCLETTSFSTPTATAEELHTGSDEEKDREKEKEEKEEEEKKINQKTEIGEEDIVVEEETAKDKDFLEPSVDEKK